MLWNFENNLLPTLNIFLSSRFPYHLTESRLFNRLRNIDWSNKKIFYERMFWTVSTLCGKYIKDFPLAFRHIFQMAQRIFPSLSERFRYRNSFTFLLSFKYSNIHGPEDETVVNQEADPPFESYHNWTTLMTRTRISARVGWMEWQLEN